MSHYFSKGKNSKVTASIFDLALKPFAEYCYKVRGMNSLYVILELFFHIEDRIIADAIATSDFKMPGNIMHGNVAVPGTGVRDVLEGKHLLIRFDKTQPGFVEIQHDMGLTEQMFRLTDIEFAGIEDYIEVYNEKFNSIRHRNNGAKPEEG